MSEVPSVARVRAYGVAPASTALQRYVGTDAPFRLSLELLRVTLSTGAEGFASCCSGWRGAPVGLLARSAAARAAHVLEQPLVSPASVAQRAADPDAGDAPDILSSLLDVALWDAMARDRGSSLQALVGRRHAALDCYASTPAYLTIDDYLRDVETALALGCAGVKFHFNGDPDFDLELVSVVDRRYGNGSLRFMADMEGVCIFDDAVRLGRCLAERNWLWLEAPFPDARLDLYSELRRAAPIDIMPAGYEHVGPAFWASGLAQGAWSRLRFDVSLSGGISGALQGLALAAAHEVPVELQSFGYLPAQAANLLMMQAATIRPMFELPLPVSDFAFSGLTGIRPGPDGRVAMPAGPGLGLELDWDRIEAEAEHVFDSL